MIHYLTTMHTYGQTSVAAGPLPGKTRRLWGAESDTKCTTVGATF